MITVLHGEDAFGADAALEKCIEELVDPSWRAMNLSVFEGDAPFAEVVSAATSVPFFGQRVVVMRDCPWFAPATRKAADDGGDDGPGGADSRAIVDFLKQGLPEGCHLILRCNRKINGSLGTTKALLAAARNDKASVKEFAGPDPFKPETTVAWVGQHAARTGRGISDEAAELLVGRLGQDRYRLDNELAKLASYAGDRAITASDVRLLSPPGDSDVFKLVEHLLRRDLAATVVDLRKLLVHDHSLRILATISSSLLGYLQEKAFSERRMSPDDIAARLKRHPYRVKLELKRLERWTSRQLLAAVQQVAAAESRLKRTSEADDLVLEQMIAQIVCL